MLKWMNRFFLCFFVLATAACASKTPLQVEGLAGTGKQYTSTLKKVNSFALDESLEFTANLLPNLPRDANTLAQQVREELLRSAAPIGQALLTNQRILEEQIQWITRRQDLIRQVQYRDDVQKPFLEDKKLPERWKKAWMDDVKQVPAIALLEQAKAASIEMQQAWVDVLRGQGSFEHLRGIFDQINSNIQAIQYDESK